MGARASPHSQLLGMPHVDPLASPYRTWIDNVAAGARRELACVKLQRNAVEMCKRYELTDLPSVQNTQILIASAQMLFFSEVEPKLARTMIRLAYGHWKDMLFSDMADDAKRQLCETYAFPLIVRLIICVCLSVALATDRVRGLVDVGRRDRGIRLEAVRDHRVRPQGLLREHGRAAA